MRVVEAKRSIQNFYTDHVALGVKVTNNTRAFFIACFNSGFFEDYAEYVNFRILVNCHNGLARRFMMQNLPTQLLSLALG
jgi:hypothetical protein